jgi:serine/threonine protein kinase
VSTREVEAQQQMTEYVVTRWYRAPELILTRSYTESIDIWAAGCILAEMLGRKPIFPGKDYMDQISKIIGVVGTPSKADMSHISGKRAKAYIAGLGEMATVPWSTLYPKASETALDLLDKCLTFNPSRRITAEEALAHPFFEKYHEEEDEPSCSEQFEFGFEFEGVENMPLEEWRELIWREACHFHPECCPSS